MTIIPDNTQRDFLTRVGNWHDVVDGNGNGSLIAQFRVLNGNVGIGANPLWPDKPDRDVRNRVGNWNDQVDLHGNGSFIAQCKQLVAVFAGLAGISAQMTALTTLVNTFDGRITAVETHNGVLDGEITTINNAITAVNVTLAADAVLLASLQTQINTINVPKNFRQKNTNATTDYTIILGDDTVSFNCTTAPAIVRIVPGTAPLQTTKIIKNGGGNPITVVNVASPTAPNAGNTLAVINDNQVPMAFEDMGVGNGIQRNY